MDHGSLGEEAVSRPGSLSDHKHHQHHARHAPDQSLDDCDHVHDTDPLAAHSPQLITIPVNPYAAANLHAYAANARAGDSTDSPDDPVDPDDFYRSYRGVQTAADAASPVKDPMASAVSSPRKTPALRPNANGTTPKQSSIPTAHRNALRAGHRSASNPVDDRLGNSASASANGYGAGGASAPSVKDLKKRFDQPSSSSPSTSAVRKAASRTARDTASSSVNGRSSGTGGGARTTAVRDAGHDSGTRPAAREAQRSKFVTENNPSSNSRSFASRVARPRASPASTSTAPRSKMQRSAAAASESPSSQPIPPRQNGLLFGEILPDENDSVTAGFGIDNVRPRRTSESSLHNPARSLMRTLSDPEVVEPPSPTDWYRTADLSRQQDQEHNASTIPRSHVRAHSDLAPSKLTLTRTNYIAKRHDTSSSMSPASPASPTSRLPIMVKKMSDSSGHDSPLSTRSNSPSTLKYTSTSGRTSRQHVSSVSRAKTPTGHAATQTRTAPSHIPAPSRKPPPASISTQGNNKLNAYVSVPPPKLSPSLRSSRPRQSVATATTAASRMRAAERGSSPLRQSQRPSQKTDESTPRRRKMSIGPIDFAQRRETIKLAYSKSIRESQAREARQAAAEKRKKELAAVARAKAEAEAAAAAALAANAAATAAATVKPTRQGSSTSGQPSENAVENEEAGEEESRAPTNELPILQQPVVDTQLSSEPLKLEIPGSFPSVGAQLDRGEMPLSAISTTTAVTEFDTEEQTEPPRPENSTAAIDNALSVVMPNLAQVPADPQVSERQPTEQPATLSLHRRASYRSPFDDECEDDDSVSIKISLDTSLQSQIPSHPTPTRTSFDSDPVPVPPAEDDEYVPRPYTFSSAKYETTVTILGPESDFKPLHKEVPGTTRPAAGSPQPDVPEVTNSIEASASQDGPMNDVDLEQSRTENEELSRPEDFYVGPRLRDNIAALRDSTFTFSDSGTPVDGQSSPATYQRTPEPSHSLTVPSLLAPANRLSQHSAWTDFSFGSDDVNASHPSSTFRSREFTHDRVSLGMEHSTGDVSACGSSLGELQQSPVVSPRDTSAPPSSPMLPEIPASQPNLGEFGIVQGFTVGRDSQPGRIAPAPERSPPDPPSSINGQDRDSTAYLEESRPSSYLHDHDEQSRPADSVRPSESASQHRLDSLEPSSVSLGDTLVEKPAPPTEEEREEQRRLRQRQLVIRELIDTEDAFVRDMSVVEEIYKGTAEACPRLDSKTIKLIFRNTDEIIAFHTALLVEFKEGASTVYTPKGRRSPLLSPESKDSDSATLNSMVSSVRPDRDDERDRLTSLGPVFCKNIEQLKAVHEVYLRSSDNSSKRLVQIQEDEAVMLWLNECNEVAKELTSAWNLDSLLIKPMQRITKYPDIITHLLKYTPDNHPDRQALVTARTLVMDAIDEINRTKKNFELVGQIVSNRKRKESDVRAGLARAFGKRVDKLQVSGAKTAEDEEYQKLQQQFGDDYLRLQVVLRDVEYYTRNVSTYVHEFLQYLSSMELVMRLQPSRDYAHIESKWVQFNVSMRDIEKIALEKHLSDVRKHVIEPFEQVIRCYGNPSLAMKKRAKRRLDYEKYVQLKANGKKIDKQLAELVEQYEALNDTLKKELPKLSAMTAQIGNICLGKFISIQAAWFLIWKEKVKAPLQDVAHVPELAEILSTFQREFAPQEERAMALAILNPTLRSRASQSTTDDASSILSRTKSRPSDLLPSRGRGLSINSDHVPTLPTPDFVKRNSGQFSLSPASSALPSPANYYRDYYSGINGHHASRGGPGSPVTPDANSAPRSATVAVRPSTGRSFDSLPRQSSESTAAYSTHGGGMGIMGTASSRRDSNSTFNSSYYPPPAGSNAEQQQHSRRLSGLFRSALPLPDGGGGGGGGPSEERSLRSSSRASSRDRGGGGGGGAAAYKVLWLAASLFEFNIETTKHEAGYPYLTYQAGEIFDVIAEKGELWLAKNQDDPRDIVGWIWSKHFAKLADS